MANKAFEIQESKLRIGGVDLEAGTTGVVIPGVTQAATYFVEEVDDRDGNNPDIFGSDASAVRVIDNSRYLALSGTTPSSSYEPAEYSVDELDDGQIEEINVEVDGVFAAADKTRAEASNMWAIVSADPYTTFVAGDWTQIPFRPKIRAGEIESIGGGGGASNLSELSDVALEGPVEGSVLTWDANEEKWVNRTPSVGADGDDGADGVGVPAGGSTGQVLAKINGTDYNTEWVTLTGGGGDTGGDPAYKGFKASYGRMWGNNDDPNGPINKIVIYKDTVTPSSTIDASTNNDDFVVTGLSGSDVVVMLVAIGEDVNQTLTSELKTFAESIIDNVILDGGIEGQINTAAVMKTAFYDNFATFSATLTDRKANFEFFSVNNQFNINPAFETGKGATVSSLQYNMADGTLGSGSWGQSIGTHQVGDIFVIPGNTIQDANGNFLSTPANDVTITITDAPDGYIGTFTVTGTLPRPAETWPANSIGDGGDDEYDTGNYITTNLSSNISYNDGNVVSGSEAFGGGDYVVTYEASIFGVFAVNPVIDSIATQGSSGMDGYGQADTGSLYGAASGVSIGDFVFTNSTMTSPDDDLYIKAVDDLWLDALADDIHLRANDDVRIKAGYNFQDDEAESEWRFDNSGIINFPNGSTQATAWTGSVDYSNINNTPTIPTDISDLADSTNLLSASVSSLVNGAHTLSLGTNGVLTLPEGGTIAEAVVTNNPTIQLTPASPDVASQKLVIKGGAPGYSTNQNGIGVNTLYNQYGIGDTVSVNVYSTNNASSTLYWWLDGVDQVTPTSGTVVINEFGGSDYPIDVTVSTAEPFRIYVGPTNGVTATAGVTVSINGEIVPDYHLHLTTGDLTETSIILGTDDHNVRTTVNGNIEITTPNATNNVWTFGIDGSLTLPPAGIVKVGIDTAQVGSTTTIATDSNGGTGAGTPGVVDVAYDNTIIPAYYYPGGGAPNFTDSTITFANGDVGTITSIVATGGYIEITYSGTTTSSPEFPIILKTGNYAAAIPAPEWEFDTNGFLTVPGTIVLPEGVITFNGDADPGIVLGSSIKSVFVRTLNGIDQYTWKFGTDGGLTLPVGGDIKNSAGTSEYISVTSLKTLVAASTDFADFQTRIAAL